MYMLRPNGIVQRDLWSIQGLTKFVVSYYLKIPGIAEVYILTTYPRPDRLPYG